MMQDHPSCSGEEFETLDHVVADYRMLLHFDPLLGRQLGGFEQNRIRDPDLANVMEEGATA